MAFPVTYLIDQLAPSETFIRREMELLRRRGWPIYTRLLKGGVSPLRYALMSCPEGFRWRFLKAAAARISEEPILSPGVALRLIKRLPQAASLIRKVTDTDSQLIHAHFAGITADLAAVASHALGLPWTCSVHARDVFSCPPDVLKRRLRTAKAITACSQEAARAVTDAGIPQEKVTVIYHGLPLYDFPFDTIHPDELIFTACRLDPKKGLDTLLRACALLKTRGTRFTCVIAGSGPQLNSLKQLTEKLSLADTVVFVGWLSQEETRSHVMDASVLVLPSRRTVDGDRDGIANILIEGLALGTPIVTTTASAASEVIIDNVNGLLVPPDDPARLADALARMLASKELRIRMATAGRQTAEKQFEGSACIQQLEAFFARSASPATQPDRPTPA
jgi:glycosyltransferase involved in cell wall biosynthesis